MPSFRSPARIALAAILIGAPASAPASDDGRWTRVFPVEKGEWSSTGRNPFFVLEPGYRLVLEDGGERLTITVLDETKVVAGVETRVVEERETEDGSLVEVSRNYFAISTRTNGVFYFGEEVEIYRDGKVAGHEGAWLAGVDGAGYGLMMPGQPLLGARYYQEVAPRVAMDRAEIVAIDATMKTLAGEFKGCLRVEETSPLEPSHAESKYYAPGIGLVKDGSLRLVRHGAADAPGR